MRILNIASNKSVRWDHVLVPQEIYLKKAKPPGWYVRLIYTNQLTVDGQRYDILSRTEYTLKADGGDLIVEAWDIQTGEVVTLILE